MNILIFENYNFGIKDAEECFQNKGHRYTTISSEAYCDRINIEFDKLFEESFEKGISGQSIDCVFTFNYSPIISNNCLKRDIPYIAFVYDNPQIQLYSYTVINRCNYIFIFDKEQYKQLKEGGVDTVYYAPLPVNMNRIKRMFDSKKKIVSKFEADISFVGSLYNEKYNLYERMYNNLSDYTKGYLDAIMGAQRNVYGYFFLENLLDDVITKELQEAYPIRNNKDGIETAQYVYANYFLARKMAYDERIEILKRIETQFGKCRKVKLYTPQKTPELKKINNMGCIDYYSEMPYVFNESKINLNITLRSIKSGIPLRAMDICGAGGFLLSNYQADFYDFFTPGEDIVLYESIDDMLSKCKYYLTHDSERERIAKNGRARIEEAHTYDIRFEEIFNMVFNTHRK